MAGKISNGIKIGGLQETTLIDYPGKVACTVFLIGCNFRCPFCYSSELVLPEKTKLHPRVSEKHFFDFLEERKGLLDGVVVCGGEPTMQKELPALLRKIKKMGFFIKLDTNGSDPKMLEELMEDKLVDYVAMDIKAPFSRYDKAAAVKIDLNKIKKSIKAIKKSGIDYEFRTTVVPGIHKKEDIVQLARDIGPARKYFLQNFRAEKTNDPKYEKARPYAREFLLEAKKEIARFFEICEVRG